VTRPDHHVVRENARPLRGVVARLAFCGSGRGAGDELAIDALCCVASARPMTDELTALRREVERWRTTATMLQIATWEHDLATNEGGWPELVAATHPDDREELVRSLEAAIHGEGTVTHRHRVVRASGEVRWVDTRVRVERDDAGRPTRLVGASIDCTDARARDISKRNAAEKALQESEQTLSELGAALPALLWVRDVASGALLYANAGWARLLGRAAVLGESFRQLADVIHPEDRDRVFAGTQRALETEFDEIVRFVDREGTSLLYRLFAFAIRDASGEPYRIAGFGVNVTARLSAEEKVRASLREKEILLKEIHHRVKNNLQIISSLLRLQATKVDEPRLSALLMESQSRVTSMALVHEMLYQSADLSRIPFASYARALGTSLISAFGVTAERVRLAVEAGDIALGVDVAVPCGLLLNEILSNSLKHAFPDDRRGTVAVVLELGADQQYHLRASDDGVGLPPDFEARQRPALGTKLIDLLADQLGGSVQRTSSKRGTRYEIAWPVN